MAREYFIKLTPDNQDDFITAYATPNSCEFSTKEEMFLVRELSPDDILIPKVLFEEIKSTLKDISNEFGTDYCDGNCVAAHDLLAKLQAYEANSKGEK